MKKTVFLAAYLFFFIGSICSYGQDLKEIECKDGMWGYKDAKTGAMVIPCKYEAVRSYASYHNLLGAKLNGKWGFIDQKGKEVIPFIYDKVNVDFGDSPIAVMRDGVWGYINQLGYEVVPFIYEDAAFFSHHGLAAVKLNGKWGFVDVAGNLVVPFKFDDSKYHFNTIYTSMPCATLVINNKTVAVDLNGNYYEYTVSKGYDPGKKIDQKMNERNTRGEYDKVLKQLEQANKQYKQKKVLDEEKPPLLSQPIASLNNSFTSFAKNYIESRINTWQIKGEFEKTIDWQQRVNENTRKAKTAELLKEAEKTFIEDGSKNFIIGNLTLDAYDADNEIYLIKNSLHGNWLVPVPIREAPNFKKDWNNLKKTPKYVISNDQLTIAEMTFITTEGKSYKYSNQTPLTYNIANINYNFAPLDINISDNLNHNQATQSINTVNINVGKSDVAINIPITNIKNDKTFAIIIANENYQEAGISQVEFAINDGMVFKEYCTKTLGIPEQNIHYKANATRNNITAALNWISAVAETYNKNNNKINVIFYYSGHGTHDNNEPKSAYLLPVDGLPTDMTTAYKQDDLYKRLGNIPTNTVFVFLDACFSGAGRDNNNIDMASKGVIVKVKQGVPLGNTVVFTSSHGDQTSYPYKEKNHGMFTYYLLKKLQETKGDITLGELSKYITAKVEQQSIVVNKKGQTPAVISSGVLDNWQDLKLR